LHLFLGQRAKFGEARTIRGRIIGFGMTSYTEPPTYIWWS